MALPFGLIALVAISLFVCPLAAGGIGLGGANAQIAFTSNVATLVWTQTVEGPGLEVVQTQEPPPVISAGSLDIGSRTYPVGDEFDDASGLRLAGVRSDPLGSVGIATIFEQPDYRLIWYTDDSGARHYIIVHKDDALYSDENGFLEHFNDYLNDVGNMGKAIGAGLTGAGTLMGLGLAGCVPSAGVGCIVGIVGGFVAMLGGIVGEAYFSYFEVRPAIEALRSILQMIDANRGATRSSSSQ